jgi:sRNA-binding carbon storage regulator CsrA
MPRLVLTRKAKQGVRVEGPCTITNVGRRVAKLAFEADDDVPVVRCELPERPRPECEPPPGVPAIVELFGHDQIAGWVSEASIAGATLTRVHVPQIDNTPAFDKYLGAGAIYALTPVPELAMLRAARARRHAPYEQAVVCHQPRLPALLYEIPCVECGEPFHSDDPLGHILCAECSG